MRLIHMEEEEQNALCDLRPGHLERRPLEPVELVDSLLDLLAVLQDGGELLLERRFLLLDAVDHVHGLGVDLLLHRLLCAFQLACLVPQGTYFDAGEVVRCPFAAEQADSN